MRAGADEIERLRNDLRVATETLDRLTKIHDTTVAFWNTDRAASQAREAQLREAFNLAMEVLYDVDTNNEVPDFGSGHLYVSRHDGPKIVKVKELANALNDLPDDDTALKARLKAERERIAEYVDRNLMSAREYAEAIRNMGDE